MNDVMIMIICGISHNVYALSFRDIQEKKVQGELKATL